MSNTSSSSDTPAVAPTAAGAELEGQRRNREAQARVAEASERMEGLLARLNGLQDRLASRLNPPPAPGAPPGTPSSAFAALEQRLARMELQHEAAAAARTDVAATPPIPATPAFFANDAATVTVTATATAATPTPPTSVATTSLTTDVTATEAKMAALERELAALKARRSAMAAALSQAKNAAAVPAPGAPPGTASSHDGMCPFSRFDVRVGKIVSVVNHPKARALYVEQVDVGEAAPRQIVSGLVNHIPIEQMNGASVVVITNMKPMSLMGEASYGMIWAASKTNDEKTETKLELIAAHVDAPVGTRITLAPDTTGTALPNYTGPREEITPQSTAWQRVREGIRVDGDGIAVFGHRALQTSHGPVRAPTIRSGAIA